MFETSFSPVTPESAETLLSAYPAFGSGDCNLTAVSLISRAAALYCLLTQAVCYFLT